MRRHKWRLLALAGLVVLAAVGAFVLWPRADRITRENFDRIREGMGREELEAILGPPGDHRTGPVVVKFGGGPPDEEELVDEIMRDWRFLGGGPAGFVCDCWRSDRLLVCIVFDSELLRRNPRWTYV